MVMIAGYENFVSRTRLSGNPEMPSWIGRLSHHDLKLNLSLTIAAISMFLLLQVFLKMTEEHTKLSEKTLEALPWMIGIHLTFVLSAVALAVINRLSNHPSPSKELSKDKS